MKAIFYNSFIEKIKQENNIEIKNFSIGDNTEKYKLYSTWKPEENLLSLSILFNSNDENKPDLSVVTKIYVYYAIFDRESNEENIAFILQDDNNSNLNLNPERNIINVRIEKDAERNDIVVKSKFTLNTPELNSDGEFLEGCGVDVGANLFREDVKDTDIVSRDSYDKLVKSSLTGSIVKGPDSTTGLDSTGKNIQTAKYRKIYKPETFVLGVFDETNYINISDEIKTKYNLPREIGYDSVLSNESDKGAYKSLKLTGSIEYDLYYVSDSGLVYVNTGSDEVTGIDGVRIVNIEKDYGFTYEIDNLLYNVNYFTPEGVDTDDPLINPYGIFVLELTYVDLDGETKTIRSNKLRLIQGGYYGYFNVISRDSNYFYPKDDAAMYLFGRRKGERKNFTLRVKSPIFTEYWEDDNISKIKSDISFEFENDYMEQELKKLFNFSFTINKIEDLEDVFDIEVEILTLKNNDDPDHWLPYCDPDGDGVDESTLSMIKLNVDLDTTVNMYFERFYCAQGNQTNNIILSNINAASYERSLVNSRDGLVYRNDETVKTLSITEEFDDEEDIELERTPFYWKVLTKPEELIITDVKDVADEETEVTKGEGEFNKYVVDAFKTGDKASVIRNKFKLNFEYNKFLGTYELPEYLTLIKLNQEEYSENLDVQDTWETFLTYNILKLPVRKEGVRPYIKIDGAVLNSRGNEVVLNLNTNPIRVEKVKVNYNATLKAKIVSDPAITDGRYKFWNGSEEVDTVTLTNLSNEEETGYLYIVIKETGKFSKSYKGAKIVFEYTPLGSISSSFTVNSEDNLTTYIKLSEEALTDSTYSVVFQEFKFNEEPGLGKGIGFAQRALAGYKNDKGDWVEPVYDSLNYINNTPNQSLSTICDVFVPFYKAASEEQEEFVPAFEARFKSSVSFELDVKQNISQYDLEKGAVFGVNEDGDYEFKYHYIKFTNKELFRDTLSNYPAAGYDLNITIKPYSYNTNTFRAVEFRLWAQRLSNELIISSNNELKGLMEKGISNGGVHSTVIYGKNNINEATAYVNSTQSTSGYKVAYIGFEVENGVSISSGNNSISHSLVKKYAGETGNLYITSQEKEGNKVLQKMSIDVDNPSTELDYYLKASADINEWDEGSIILKTQGLAENSVSDYLAGYAVNLPGSVKGKLDLASDTPVVVSYNKFKLYKTENGQTTEVGEYNFNWYNETEFSGDNVITGERGNPGGDYFVYATPLLWLKKQDHVGTIQIRNTDKYDRELQKSNEVLVLVREGLDYYIKRWKAEEIVDNRDLGISVYTPMDDGTLRDITNDIKWDEPLNPSATTPEYPILRWSDNIPLDRKNWINVKFKYNNTIVTGDDVLTLDTGDFTFKDSGSHVYEFSRAEYEKTIGYNWFPLKTFSEQSTNAYHIPDGYKYGDVFCTKTKKTIESPMPGGSYWIGLHSFAGSDFVSIAFPVNSQHPNNPYVGTGTSGSTTISNVNHINGTSIYVRPVSSMSGKNVKYQKASLITGSVSDISFAYKYEIVCDNGHTYTAFDPYTYNQSFVVKGEWTCEQISSSDPHYHLKPDYYYNGDISGLTWSTFNGYGTSIQATYTISDNWSKSRRNGEWGYYTAAMDFLSNNDEFEITNGSNTYTVRITHNNSGTRAGMWYWGTDNDHLNLYTARLQKSMLPDINGEDTDVVHKGILIQTTSGTSYGVLNGYIPVIIAARNVDDVNAEIAYLFLKSEAFSRKGVVNSGDYDKVFLAPNSSESNSFTFTVDKYDRNKLAPFGGQGSFNVSSLSTALTDLSADDQYQATGGTSYKYPYFSGSSIMYFESSIKIGEGGVLTDGSRSVKYYKTTNTWYESVFWGDDYCSYNTDEMSTDDGPFIVVANDNNLYGIHRCLYPTISENYLIAEKVSDSYLDFYKTNTQPTATYIAKQMAENPNIQILPGGCQQSITPERKVYTYEDYKQSRYSVYQYFDWFNGYFFEKNSDELDSSPFLFSANSYLFGDYGVMSDGITNVHDVVNMYEASNSVSKDIVSKGYEYVLYKPDGQTVSYYSLNPHDIDATGEDVIFYTDPRCTTKLTEIGLSAGDKNSLYGSFGIHKIDNTCVHAINFVDGVKIIQNLNSDYVENGMGFPRKKGKGSKYIIETGYIQPDEPVTVNFCYFYEVVGGSEWYSASKVVLSMDKTNTNSSFYNIKLINPDGQDSSEVNLTKFYYNGYFYQLGNSNYYVYSGSGANTPVTHGQTPYEGDRMLMSTLYGWLPDSTQEDKYFEIWKENDPLNQNPRPIMRDPSIGLVFEFDNANLGDRPRTGLMYPVSEGVGEDYKPIYHIDRTEQRRTEKHYIDYAVIEEPKAGLTTKLYTVDYDNEDKVRKRRDFWDIKPVDTGKTVTFNSISNLPGKELKLFTYKYSTDSETRIFLPIPDRLRQDEIITENFIGNPEKTLNVIVKNPDFKVVVPDYTFPASGDTIRKELSITNGYLLTDLTHDDKYLPSEYGWRCELGEVNGEPDPNYWSSYVGYEEKYLEFSVPDRYDHEVENGGSINTSKEITNFGTDVNGYFTRFKPYASNSYYYPTYKVTQLPVFYGIRLKITNPNNPGSPLLNNTWVETTEYPNIIYIPDTLEVLNADPCVGFNYKDVQSGVAEPNTISIQAIEDPHNIIGEIELFGESGVIHVNRNHTREDRSCKLKFTNTNDSNTTALIVEVMQRAVVPTLELYYNYESDPTPIASNLYFGADGILKNPTDVSGKSDGILYVRTNLLNDIVDTSLISLKQRKEKIYKLLKLSINNVPVFYEISVINSSRGDLYYSGEGYDDVYRVYKLVNVAKLPNVSVSSDVNDTNAIITGNSLSVSCRVSTETGADSKSVSYSCSYGTFSVMFNKCAFNYYGGDSYFTQVRRAVDEGSIIFNEDVTKSNRPESYSHSKYKTERNPDIHYLYNSGTHSSIQFMNIAHGNELSGGYDTSDDEDWAFIHIPINYLKVIRYDKVLNATTGEWEDGVVVTVFDKLIISNTVDIKEINSQEDYSPILQGVLSDVSYGNAPDSITLGGSTFNVDPSDKGYVKLLRYTTVNSGSYRIRNTINLEYRDKSMRYPFKCRLFVYFDLDYSRVD